MRFASVFALPFAVSVGLSSSPLAADGLGSPAPARPAWALAIHGGAGTPPRDMPEERKRAYLAALSAALAEGKARLERGEPALDVVEAVVRWLEEDPMFNAGRGAVFTAEGTHELDAAIMDGSTLGCGAVAGLTTVRNPVSLARRIMEKSPYVFLAGLGAERFADDQGVERVANDWFSTPERREQLERERAKAKAAGLDHAEPTTQYGTVGAVALDRAGHLAAATSTGGTTNKRWGRIGDVPVIGAGTFADDATVAVSCTGRGEEFIRQGAAREIAALVRYQGKSVAEAARILLEERLKKGDGGLIAIGKDGEIAMPFNSEGMFRGAADALGRFEVAIWE